MFLGAQAGCRGQPFKSDFRVGLDQQHFRQQPGGKTLDFFQQMGGVGARHGACLEFEDAFLGHNVRGQAAANQAGLHRGVRHGETVITGFKLRKAVSHLPDVDNDARGVFNRIDTQIGVAGMGFPARDAAAKTMGSLVCNDGLHRSRLTDDAAGGFQVHVLQVGNQAFHADAADFLVIRKGQVQRCVHLGSQKPGGQRQCGGDVAFHVARSTAIEQPILDGGFEGVCVPRLALDRHDIGVPGQNQSGLAAFAERGKQIGFLAGRVIGQARGDAQPGQIVAYPFDHAEVGVAGNRRERNQPLNHGKNVGRGLEQCRGSGRGHEVPRVFP